MRAGRLLALRREQGFALLIVLWTLALLSLLISQLAGSGRQAVRLAANLRTQAVLQATVDGAVQEAGFHLAADGSAHWAANGVVRAFNQGGAAIRLRITSEAGRVNPSIASLELMTALVHGCGVDLPKAATIASAIVAWRFPSGQSSYGIATYRQAGLAFGPPGQPFESLDEVGLVMGVTPDLLACLRPHLSLYRDTDPDPNAADPAVLHALAETMGAVPPLTDAPVDQSVVVVSAVATGPGGARAARVAILRMELPPPASDGEPGQGSAGSAPFRIMTWHR